MAFRIDKDVPIPGNEHLVYPFPVMEVGDSFYIKTDKHEHTRSVVITSARKWIKSNVKTGWAFVTRKDKDGVRIWRKK